LKCMRVAGKTQLQVADHLEVSRATVAKYEKSHLPPSQLKVTRTHLTRQNPFEEVLPYVHELLKVNPGLETKTIFQHLQGLHLGRFQDGQKRTLERKVSLWKLLNGPEKEITFPQVHCPGELGASDYTKMNKLGITIGHQPFDHMLYHFVLTYSNWETVTICFSETFESLSEGFQNAVTELGGVPHAHRTDNLGAAVINMGADKGEMTKRYKGLLDHYGVERSKIQPGKPNENGDIERSNGILKKAIDQRLMIRGHRDFDSIIEYEAFLKKLMKELNAGRSERFKEELPKLRALAPKRLEAYTPFSLTVSCFSTLNVNKIIYSVPSRLIGHKFDVKQFSNQIELWSHSVKIFTIPRIIGKKVSINYRHMIEWLVRKPGAFVNYKYHAEMFPTSTFREAYDDLLAHHPSKSSKEYLNILHLAATHCESEVDQALKTLLDEGKKVSHYLVFEMITRPKQISQIEVHIDAVSPKSYDKLIGIQYGI
jgi:transcriptional regulator with XRE-family HTH domain